MELTDYLRVLRKYWVSVVAILLAGVGAAAAASMLMTPIYTASAGVFLTVNSGATAGELNQGSTYAENQVRSYAQVVTAPVVLQPVIDRLRLGVTAVELADQVTATVPINTAIVNIDVTGADAPLTADTANAIAQQLTVVVDELSPQSQEGKTVKATIISPASVPVEWTSPRVPMNLALGALLGLLLGFGQAILRFRLDTRIVGEPDVARVTDRSVVGAIAFDTDAKKHPLIFQTSPNSVRAEAYRRLRTNLQFLQLEEGRSSIVVTSSVAGEGKTTTAINLATALGDAGQSVLLIEADLRRPSFASYLNLDDSAGLTDVIIGRATLPEVVQPLGRGNLHVLLSGRIPPNPSELLGSKPMEKLLAEATERYDTVIIDSPPLLPVTDSALLSRFCGGVLLVVGSGEVTRPELATAISSLEAVDAAILGLVMNRLRASELGHYGYHHYYAQHERDDKLKVDETVKRQSLRAMPISPADVFEDRH
ncbi:MAG: polysaccharide biosynthesis tyrosine autokinase [Propionibacteriaceae bacterium]|nr:polysaccharide biosynthesis tyrosine autokinase [Propionibacteriaceae bacterium]